MASSSTYAFFHCHYAFQKFPFFCVTLCVFHALQNATPSHSAEHATHTGWHKRTGTFEMRSGSERMRTWRRTPSTGRNFQTLMIWITVSLNASFNGSVSVNFFFFGFLQFLLGFSKVPVFFVSPCISALLVNVTFNLCTDATFIISFRCTCWLWCCEALLSFHHWWQLFTQICAANTTHIWQVCGNEKNKLLAT